MTHEVVAAAGLRVRRGRTEVLRGVDVRLARGEIVVLLGPNGAGKSTLVGALVGTVPIASGRVVRSGRLAAVLQTPGLAHRSALANVELALAWWGVPRRERRAVAVEAFTRMGSAHLADRPAATLSGGERRRVHLARALAVPADAVLLDEPFDGLDGPAHDDLRDDTVAALRAGGAATLIVLHDRSDMWAVADRVIVLVDGAVHADGAPAELLAAPPTIETARLLGYDGDLASGSGGRRLTRAVDVRIDPDGELAGTVRRVVPTETDARVLVEVAGGHVWSLAAPGEARVGDAVRVRVERAVEPD